MMKPSDFLVDTTYFDDKVLEPKTFIAYLATCTSDRCRLHSNREEDRTDTGVVKKVGRYAAFCKDCGHALFWNRIEAKK